MCEEQNPVLEKLAEVLNSGEVGAVFMHRQTNVPAVVAEAVVEQGVPVHLVDDE